MNKHILAIILALGLTLTITSCGQSNNQNNNTSSQSASVHSQMDFGQGEDIVCTDLTVGFLDEESGDTLNFSLDLPANWTVNPGVACDMFDGDNWVGVIQASRKSGDSDPPFSDIDQIYDGAVYSKEMSVSGYPAKCYVLELRDEGSDQLRTQYLYYIMTDDAYVLFYFDSEIKTDIIEAGFDKIVLSFRLAENLTSQTSESGQETSKVDLWIDITDYDVRVSVPANWENNITVIKMDMPEEDAVTYGFLLSPKDMQVEEQYVGALRIYSETVWNLLDETAKEEEIKLSVMDGKVYAYRNSLFNQYPSLPQAELFDTLALADEDVERLLHIEKIQ